ncbi:hypothetical protein [Niveispirillum sp. KHB5.9]|uniref:hypothetical protein n=1 Tax=Niveispirillum sp. KHB5.9 TaxID=3400269 RepID=UPI003A89A720
MHHRNDGEDELNAAYDRLERELPPAAVRVLEWLRSPRARRVRLVLGMLLICAGFLWFLPIVSIEMLPVGLLLIAIDVPFLRRPIAAFVMWLLDKWMALRNWWQRRH